MAMKLLDFVMTWQGGAQADGDNPITTLAIHGPFETEKAAAEWGRLWQEDEGDDPRWNTIMLPADTDRLVVQISSPHPYAVAA